MHGLPFKFEEVPAPSRFYPTAQELTVIKKHIETVFKEKTQQLTETGACEGTITTAIRIPKSPGEKPSNLIFVDVPKGNDFFRDDDMKDQLAGYMHTCLHGLRDKTQSLFEVEPVGIIIITDIYFLAGPYPEDKEGNRKDIEQVMEETPRPSEHPDRREALCAALHLQGCRSMYMREYLRVRNQVVMMEEDLELGSVVQDLSSFVPTDPDSRLRFEHLMPTDLK